MKLNPISVIIAVVGAAVAYEMFASETVVINGVPTQMSRMNLRELQQQQLYGTANTNNPRVALPQNTVGQSPSLFAAVQNAIAKAFSTQTAQQKQQSANNPAGKGASTSPSSSGGGTSARADNQNQSDSGFQAGIDAGEIAAAQENGTFIDSSGAIVVQTGTPISSGVTESGVPVDVLTPPNVDLSSFNPTGDALAEALAAQQGSPVYAGDPASLSPNDGFNSTPETNASGTSGSDASSSASADQSYYNGFDYYVSDYGYGGGGGGNYGGSGGGSNFEDFYGG